MRLIRIAGCLYLVFFLGKIVPACVVGDVCYNEADCPGDKVCMSGKCVEPCLSDEDCLPDICDPGTGKCIDPECAKDTDCKEGFECTEGRCVSTEPIRCPVDMVPINDRFCIDIYEASRPDATDRLEGSDYSMAMSVPNKKQWKVEDNAEALGACQRADKTLCAESQWFEACQGPDETVYGYDDEYDPVICSGIDKYCNCGADSSCEDRDPCPFTGCFHVCERNRIIQDPTGSNPGCLNGFGVYDMNGGVWEHVLNGDETRIRGGAYNCSDSKKLHRCDYIPEVWSPSARGFRCCSFGLGSGD
ncbi:MAG: hypothetical protein JRJ19_00045 [Deltaproteobacteria bacterium]|nr:hypothetical protein [Deltaproteobacteria bacterium]